MTNRYHSQRVTPALMVLLGLSALGPGALKLSADAPTLAPSTQTLTPSELKIIAHDVAQHIGDQPEVAPPPATDLSPALTSEAIRKATRKVADWQLARAEPYFNQQWTYGALYTGFMALSSETGDMKYRDAMLAMGKKLQWQIADRPRLTADDQCIGQTYLDLFLQFHDPAMMTPTRELLDRLAAAPDAAPSAGQRLPWWWCDALYMAPPVWVRTFKATGDTKYLDYMNRQWWATSNLLYDTKDHLYHRDASYIGKTEANGKPIYWSRGNGWVLGGLVRVIPFLPADYPDRPKYIAQFKEMAAKVITLQGQDGLWRAGLLDPASYDLPEVSGSAFFTYALAWGINQGLLDRATYQPVVAKAWAGMLSHIYADGRLGCIQQTGPAPAHFRPTATAVYGVGAFLLAGSEVDRLASAAKK